MNMLVMCNALLLGFAFSVVGQPLNNGKTEGYPVYVVGFVTDTEESEFTSSEGYYYLAVTNAVMPEMLADNQDVDGNWGKPADGLQLSIRFHQKEFLSNQPVLATVILRNLTSEPRALVASDRMWEFTLSHGTNSVVWRKPIRSDLTHVREDNGIFGYTIKPKSEGLLAAHINRFFTVGEPGGYSIQVEMFVMSRDGSKTNVMSGTANFEVVDKLSPTVVSAIDDRRQKIQTFLKRASP